MKRLLETARAALGEYDLPRASSLQPIASSNNAVFEVVTEAGERFALRLHRPSFRAVVHTRSELGFLQALEADLRWTSTRVPQPIAARDGRLVVEVDGGRGAARHCDVLTWVDGRVLRPGRGLGPRATHAVGEALARIHSAGERFRPPRGFELPRWDADALFTEASPFRPGRLADVMSPGDWSLFRYVEERTRAVFERLEREGAAAGIIHADFILLNCHLRRRGGWEVGVIDFDDLGWGWLVYDLAPLLGNLADFPGYAARRDAFLAGYRSVRVLPAALEEYLPTLMAARHAAACAWVVGIHRTSGAGPPVAEHIAIRMELIRQCLALG